MKKPSTVMIHGEPSYPLKSKLVKLAVSENGGHLYPMEFLVGKKWVNPFSLAPLKPKECPKDTPPLLKRVRGDFFCFPFGAEEGRPIHGETASNKWKLSSSAPGRLEFQMNVRYPAKGKVTKTLRITERDRAIYQCHTIEGFSGNFNFGYHAVIHFNEKESPYHLRTSPVIFGGVLPAPCENPAIGEYACFKPGATFKSLNKIPLAKGGFTSLAEYQTPDGYEDIAMVTNADGDFAWTAITFKNYLWMSLKDPSILASTLFWNSNGGRHFSPWNGKHRRRLGVEEVTSAYCGNLAQSRQRMGLPKKIKTTLPFNPKTPTFVKQIHLVHEVPEKFGGVAHVRRSSGSITVTGESGKTVDIPVYWRFLHEEC